MACCIDKPPDDRILHLDSLPPELLDNILQHLLDAKNVRNNVPTVAAGPHYRFETAITLVNRRMRTAGLRSLLRHNKFTQITFDLPSRCIEMIFCLKLFKVVSYISATHLNIHSRAIHTRPTSASSDTITRSILLVEPDLEDFCKTFRLFSHGIYHETFPLLVTTLDYLTPPYLALPPQARALGSSRTRVLQSYCSRGPFSITVPDSDQSSDEVGEQKAKHTVVPHEATPDHLCITHTPIMMTPSQLSEERQRRTITYPLEEQTPFYSDPVGEDEETWLQESLLYAPDLGFDRQAWDLVVLLEHAKILFEEVLFDEERSPESLRDCVILSINFGNLVALSQPVAAAAAIARTLDDLPILAIRQWQTPLYLVRVRLFLLSCLSASLHGDQAWMEKCFAQPQLRTCKESHSLWTTFFESQMATNSSLVPYEPSVFLRTASIAQHVFSVFELRLRIERDRLTVVPIQTGFQLAQAFYLDATNSLMKDDMCSFWNIDDDCGFSSSLHRALHYAWQTTCVAAPRRRPREDWRPIELPTDSAIVRYTKLALWGPRMAEKIRSKSSLSGCSRWQFLEERV